MQQTSTLLSEIYRLTSEIKKETPHLEKFLKDVPGPGVEHPSQHEKLLREHLAGLRMILENNRR